MRGYDRKDAGVEIASNDTSGREREVHIHGESVQDSGVWDWNGEPAGVEIASHDSLE